MTRQMAAAVWLTVVVAGLGTAAGSTHNEYRIIGVVQKVSPKSLSVKQNKDGKVVTMEMDAESIVTRDKKKVPQSELKIGLNVVVDACGDSIDKLLVMEVRLVPPPPRSGRDR
jgi:hypothetical protein